MTLEELRQQLNQLDGELLALIAQRQAISREVAAAKRATGHPTRDYKREREVLLGVRAKADEASACRPDIAEQVLRLLIRSSLTTQEQASVAAHGLGQRPQGAGHRRRRQDGRLVRASSWPRRVSPCRWPIRRARRPASRTVADWRALPT